MDAETREKEIKRLMRVESMRFEQADSFKKERKRCKSEGYSAQRKALALMKEAEDEKSKAKAFAAGFEAAKEMAAQNVESGAPASQDMVSTHIDDALRHAAACIRALQPTEPDHG